MAGESHAPSGHAGPVEASGLPAAGHDRSDISTGRTQVARTGSGDVRWGARETPKARTSLPRAGGHPSVGRIPRVPGYEGKAAPLASVRAGPVQTPSFLNRREKRGHSDRRGANGSAGSNVGADVEDMQAGVREPAAPRRPDQRPIRPRAMRSATSDAGAPVSALSVQTCSRRSGMRAIRALTSASSPCPRYSRPTLMMPPALMT